MKKFFLLIFLSILSLTLVSAGNHCRDNGNWCCNDPGYVICGKTNVCGPSDAWCANYLKPELSCIPGQDWCCYDAGWIADYSAKRCCPPEAPYYDGSGCRCNPIVSISNNYYTKNSNCVIQRIGACVSPDSYVKQEKCDGASYSVCQESGKFIYNFVSQGIIAGKCGVECTSDSGCPSIAIVGEPFCSGMQLLQATKKYSCQANKCVAQDTNTVLETCDYKCDVVNNQAQCIARVCDEGSLRCNVDSVEVCQNNQFIFKEECSAGCLDGKCKTPVWIYIAIGAGILVVLVGVVILVIKLTRKKKKRKN